MTTINPKFKRGDIISSDYGNAFVIALADDETQWYFGFSHNTTYKMPYGQQGNYTKIGEFPIDTIEDAISNAKNQFIDLQTQVNIAVSLMGRFLEVDGKNTLLVLSDMRVDKDKNIVYVLCSTGGGKPNTWKSVVKLCEDYGVDKHGVQ